MLQSMGLQSQTRLSNRTEGVLDGAPTTVGEEIEEASLEGVAQPRPVGRLERMEIEE